MRRMPLTARLAVVLAAAAVAAPFTLRAVAARGVAGAPATSGPAAAGMPGHWVDTWVAAPQLTEPGNMPPPPFTQHNLVFADSTVRQAIHLTVGGEQTRLRFSNAYGGTDLPITAVSVALPAGGRAGASAIQPGTARAVTFAGQAAVDIPVGAQVVSDPMNFPVAPQSNVTVTMYLAEGQASDNITSHPGSRTASYLLAGNHLDDQDLTGAASVDHWYFISGAEVWSKPATAGVAVLGDSLTDGRGSTTNGNDRWTDQLFSRLQASAATASVPVLNQGLGGNRLLQDGLGPNVLARMDRDVLAQSGVKWLIIFEGVNDIGTAGATPAAQKQVADQLIGAFEQIITRAHAMGIRVYGATITPFGGNSMYDDPAGYRAAARQAVNQWLRTSHRFDAVLDFDQAARDPASPGQILPAFDSGDHLHLNPAGYKALADAVPTSLFKPGPLPPDFGFN